MSTTSIFKFREGFESPFGNWLVNKDSNQYQRHYFNKAHVSKKDNIQLLNNVAKNTSKTLNWFVSNSNPDYVIKVFFDSDGVQLLQQYENYPIKSKEIAVFFETDDVFNFTGSVYRIRLGKTVIKDLNRFFWEKDEVDADELAEYLISTFPGLKAIGVNNLEKLIKGEVTKDKWTFGFNALFKVFKIHPLDVLNIFSIVANGIQALRPRDPIYWDATKKNYSSIFLLPTILKNIDEKKLAETIHENLIKSIDSFLKKIEDTKEESFNNYNFVIPNTIKNLINKNLDAIIVFYEDEIKPNSKSFIENGFAATKESVYIINAFFTGIFSGLLNLIANIIELVGFILKYSLDSKTRVTILEEIENTIEALFTNTKEVLNKTWKQLKKIIQDIEEYLTVETKYEAAFKVGEAIFEIAEYFVAILKIAKSKKVTDLLKRIRKGSSKEAIGKEVKTKLDKIGKKFDNLSKSIKNLDEIYKIKYTRPKGLFNKLTRKQVLDQYGKEAQNLFDVVEQEWTLLRKKLKTGNARMKNVLVSGMVDTQTGKISKIFSNFTKVEVEKGKHLEFIKQLHPTLRKRLDEHIIRSGENGSKLNLEDPSVYKYAWKSLDNAHAEFRALDDLLYKIDPKAELGESVFNRIMGYNSFLKKEGIMHTCADCFYLTYGVTFIK